MPRKDRIGALIAAIGITILVILCWGLSTQDAKAQVNQPSFPFTGSEVFTCYQNGVPKDCTLVEVASYVGGSGGGTGTGLTFPLDPSLGGTGSTSVIGGIGFMPLNSAANLSDLTNVTTARTNLGLGSASTHPVTDFILSTSGPYLVAANNLHDLQSAATARTNLGLGSAATLSSTTWLQTSSNLNDLPSPATARTNLGLGTAAQAALGTSGSTVPVLSGANNWGAKQTFVASTTGSASINIPPASNPATTVDGDMWGTASGLYTRVSGSIYNLIAITGTSTPGQVEGSTSTNTALTPSNVNYSPFAAHGWIGFHYSGSSLTTSAHQGIVASVSRVAKGHYQLTTSGGQNFTYGYALCNGGGQSGGAAGSIATGTSFNGTNPTIDVYFGDSGNSGGEASDPPDAFCAIFGLTAN